MYQKYRQTMSSADKGLKKKHFVNCLPSTKKKPGLGTKSITVTSNRSSPYKQLNLTTMGISNIKNSQNDITLTIDDHFQDHASCRTLHPEKDDGMVKMDLELSKGGTDTDSEEECNLNNEALGEFLDTVNEESFFMNFESNRSKINSYNIEPTFKKCKFLVTQFDSLVDLQIFNSNPNDDTEIIDFEKRRENVSNFKFLTFNRQCQ